MKNDFAHLTTESINLQTQNIDECSTEEMLYLINDQDAMVAAAVRKEIPSIAKAVDIIYARLSNGGHMIYVGAGTSGRLGVLDASECPPTYGTSPELVQGYIAGGDRALRTAVEGCEDSFEQGAALIDEQGVTAKDVVVGITASGSARYVLAAVERAKALGAATVGVVNNTGTKLSEICDICIEPIVGPEVVVGSTRMKAGTAQKLVLNMLTTCTMIKLGKVYGNLMVDLKASNKKLYDRACRIICAVTAVSEETAKEYLQKANGSAKLAVFMIESGLEANEAQIVLDKYHGVLKQAIRAQN